MICGKYRLDHFKIILSLFMLYALQFSNVGLHIEYSHTSLYSELILIPIQVYLEMKLPIVQVRNSLMYVVCF